MLMLPSWASGPQRARRGSAAALRRYNFLLVHAGCYLLDCCRSPQEGPVYTTQDRPCSDSATALQWLNAELRRPSVSAVA
jgi:hypothetical protein